MQITEPKPLILKNAVKFFVTIIGPGLPRHSRPHLSDLPPVSKSHLESAHGRVLETGHKPDDPLGLPFPQPMKHCSLFVGFPGVGFSPVLNDPPLPLKTIPQQHSGHPRRCPFSAGRAGQWAWLAVAPTLSGVTLQPMLWSSPACRSVLPLTIYPGSTWHVAESRAAHLSFET